MAKTTTLIKVQFKFTSFPTESGKTATTGEVSTRVSITHLDCSTMSICEADVVLTEALEPETDYYLSLEVKDTRGETTLVESHLQSTYPQGAFQG